MAIGFAALAATIWAVIVPALLAYKTRQLYPDSQGFKVPGGNALIVIVVMFGAVTAICHLLAMADILPVYK